MNIDETIEETSQLPPGPQGINLNFVQQLIHHLVDNLSEEEEENKMYRKASAKIFAYICNLLDIDISDFGEKPSKRKLFETIKHSVNF
jgi:hypothetical protein